MATKRVTTAAPGRYASVNGLSIYYEVHGAGRPLVLLHGALTTIEGTFGRMLPTLAETSLQRHGRSSPSSSRGTAAPPTSTAR